MTTESERYDLVCKERFDAIEKNTTEIVQLLRGRNSDPGVLDDVRNLKRAHKGLIGVMVFIVMTIGVQVIAWAWAKLAAAFH